jgi:hypothetical protein
MITQLYNTAIDKIFIPERNYLMTTVKEVKAGTEMPEPIYVEKPYVIIGKREKVVLHAGTIESIKEISSYYDDCSVEVRQYDLYLNDNTKIPVALPSRFALLDD